MLRLSPKICVILLLATTAISCRSKTTDAERVTHAVVCWQKTPGDEATRKKLIETSKELGKLPGVLNVAAGRAVPSTRPVVDATFDVAFVMTFRDEKALHAYETNPTHVKAVNEILKPLVEKITVYDIRE